MERVIYIWLALVCGMAVGQDNYHVKENDNSIDLKTPYGDKEIPDVNSDDGMDSYKIVIPLKDLQPPPPPPTPPKDEKAVDDKDKDKVKDKDAKDQAKDDSDDDDEQDETPVKPNDKANAPTDAAKAGETPAVGANPAPTPAPTPDYDDSDEKILEANWLYNHRRYFEASTMVKRILIKQPNLIRAWIMKGSLLFVQGEKDLAVKAWQHAQTLDPKNAEVRELLEKYK